MKCDIGRKLIHYSMNNGLYEVFINCVTVLSRQPCNITPSDGPL